MSQIVQLIMRRYQRFDLNQDGEPSINGLTFLNFEQSSAELLTTDRMVLVLVESRLLEPLGPTADLLPHLERFKGDLRAEGFFSRFIAADLYCGKRHQDGRTLLALRKFLRDIWTTFPNFLGVVLVGSFPEATLVRRTIWRPSFKVEIAGVTYNDSDSATAKTPYLAIVPELIAHRSEIVLADLNGGWDALYHENETGLESIQALPDNATAATAWPVDGAVFSATAFNRTNVLFRDFFFINDGDYTVMNSPPGRLHLFIRHRQLHPELALADRSLANPLARPDILVSRVNARHIALTPKARIVGDNGARPLDAQGLPQTFTSRTHYRLGELSSFESDPVLERRLLADFFDRNHRFRTGAFDDLPFRAGAIGAKGENPGRTLESGVDYAIAASPKFEPPLVKEDANLLDYVQWLKNAAALRLINAHSSAVSSGFHGAYAVAELESAAGGRPFRWQRTNTTYTPSFEEQGAGANFFLHRTLWQNGVLAHTGANLFIHGGCSTNSTERTQEEPHYDDDYALGQNAEGILFYLNGLALISRAKVFNDLPSGFPGAFAVSSRARFGDGWRAIFDNDAADAGSAQFSQVIRAKKAYFWSMIGDWSVRLRYRNGLGILGLKPECQSLHVHADQAWIDGWNVDTSTNRCRGAGDIDGDGLAEFILTSDWGIAILKHDGKRWRSLIASPNDTWFGGWRYNASVNTGKDRIRGVANLTGNSKKEILVTSSWGIGVLSLVGETLHAIVARANGTRFGGWVFDSRANQILAIADFDGDGRDEVLVSSNWGIAILKVVGSTFTAVMLAPHGTRVNGWLLAPNNRFGPVGDFDGDGKAEVLVSSPWGIGVLKLAGNALTALTTAVNGTRLGNWTLNTAADSFGLAGDFDGDGKAELLVNNAAGLGLLKLSGASMVVAAMARNGARLDGWMLDMKQNTIGLAGDFDGDRRAKAVIRSPWGIGFLGVESGAFRCPRLYAHGSRLGDWVFETRDSLMAVENFSGTSERHELLVLKPR
jgi:hypothetical protein